MRDETKKGKKDRYMTQEQEENEEEEQEEIQKEEKGKNEIEYHREKELRNEGLN